MQHCYCLADLQQQASHGMGNNLDTHTPLTQILSGKIKTIYWFNTLYDSNDIQQKLLPMIKKWYAQYVPLIILLAVC